MSKVSMWDDGFGVGGDMLNCAHYGKGELPQCCVKH